MLDILDLLEGRFQQNFSLPSYSNQLPPCFYVYFTTRSEPTMHFDQRLMGIDNLHYYVPWEKRALHFGLSSHVHENIAIWLIAKESLLLFLVTFLSQKVRRKSQVLLRRLARVFRRLLDKNVAANLLLTMYRQQNEKVVLMDLHVVQLVAFETRKEIMSFLLQFYWRSK